MSHSNHIDVDVELLGKYLSGEAAPEEAMAIDSWLAASAENRTLYEQVSAVWEQGLQQPVHQLPVKEAVWVGIASHLPRNPQPKVFSLRNYERRLLAAACVLVVVAAGIFFLLSRKKDPAVLQYITQKAGVPILRDTLPDHSIVVQNSYSVLQYPAGFSGPGRALSLAGEAWFDVQTDAARPFVISVGGIQVKVIGTSFNVRQSDSTIETLVKTGRVMMYNASDTILINAGQKGVYNAREHTFHLINSFNANDLGYATRVFNFENAELKDIAGHIEKAYGISVVFASEKLKHLSMSSSFDNNTLAYIFDVISVTLNTRYRIENKTVYISGGENNE
jgi:ferric-dicitrate binding protein FerR (iron transport regulator)